MMKFIFGLGNPGSNYVNTRHNVGSMVIDQLMLVSGLKYLSLNKKLKAEVSKVGQIVFAKPITYMNESGRALGEAARFYNLSLDDIFVIHDELDLPSGKMRTKTGGGHAGNNGVRSIKAHLGDDFHRVRIGVGHPGDKSKVSGHVLKDFAKSDQQWLSRMITAIADEVPLLLSGELSSFQNKVHLATNSK